ncbi:MAG: multicopper oxidase domain-containing protein [Calditrichaeota bacterium]|nr:multicopper oxidase domain-containing protein [Calditrichota bacterium]
MNRRKFLGYAAVSLGAGLAGFRLVEPLTRSGTATQPRTGPNPDFAPDVDIQLTARPDAVPILPGRETAVWSYQAEVLAGPQGAVQNLPGTYLGPVFRFQRGQKVRIRFRNQIEQESVVHWHGLHVPQEYDGHPRFAIKRGQTYVYEFEIKDRPGMYWFHPHPHGKTGPQVYRGLAGLLFVTGQEEEALDLPSGDAEIPLVIQDRTFDRNNQLVYLTNRMQRMTGFLGNTILVNGKPEAELNLATRAYRLRVLNGSNSRIYKLAWSDGTPVTVLGTDGGLLDAPVQKPYVVLGPAERLDIWLDLSGRTPGDELLLKSLRFSGASGGMMGGMMGGGMMQRGQSVPQNGDELTLVRVRVTRKESEKRTLPRQLSPVERIPVAEARNAARPRTFRFAMRGMQPTINGRTFQMTSVADDEVVRLNTTEVWELVNDSSGMMGGMMQIPHPVHVHGLQFQVLERSPSAGWESIKDGFVDNGWKDSVLLMPGMRMKIILRFRDYPGLFLYHCHNLEHEDLGMMRNYLVKA